MREYLNSYAIFTSDSSVEHLTNVLGIWSVCVMFLCTNELGILVWLNVNRSVSWELDIAYDWNPWYEYIQQPLPWPQCRPDATPRPTGDCPVDWPAPCSPAVVFPLADPVDVLASHVCRDSAAFHPLSLSLFFSHSLFPFVCLFRCLYISFFVCIFLAERGPPSFRRCSVLLMIYTLYYCRRTAMLGTCIGISRVSSIDKYKVC